MTQEKKYNTPDIWGCNKSAKMKTSVKLTPEYLINNGWNESGIAGKWC